jgi:hypothetical protein
MYVASGNANATLDGRFHTAMPKKNPHNGARLLLGCTSSIKAIDRNSRDGPFHHRVLAVTLQQHVAKAYNSEISNALRL